VSSLSTNGIKLTEQQSRALAFIEQAFYSHGGLPTNDQIAETLGISAGTIARYWQNESFRAALAKRGIDLSPEASKGLLTPKQLHVANMMLNMHDKRSPREKLKEADVTSQQYHVWLRQSAFQNYLKRRAEELFKASDSEAYMSLIETVRGGDVNAIKLFFEMRGVYTPRAQLDVNVESVMVRVIEIVAKHVQDGVVLQKIADDIEALSIGGRRALTDGNLSLDL
jgi:hypothetical protein